MYKFIKGKVFFIHIFFNQLYEWIPRSSVWESYSQGVETVWQNSLVTKYLKLLLIFRFFGWRFQLIEYGLVQGLLPHLVWGYRWEDGVSHTIWHEMSLINLWLVVGEQSAEYNTDDWPHGMVYNGHVIKLRWCVDF